MVLSASDEGTGLNDMSTYDEDIIRANSLFSHPRAHSSQSGLDLHAFDTDVALMDELSVITAQGIGQSQTTGMHCVGNGYYTPRASLVFVWKRLRVAERWLTRTKIGTSKLCGMPSIGTSSAAIAAAADVEGSVCEAVANT